MGYCMRKLAFMQSITFTRCRQHPGTVWPFPSNEVKGENKLAYSYVDTLTGDALRRYVDKLEVVGLLECPANQWTDDPKKWPEVSFHEEGRYRCTADQKNARNTPQSPKPSEYFLLIMVHQWCDLGTVGYCMWKTINHFCTCCRQKRSVFPAEPGTLEDYLASEMNGRHDWRATSHKILGWRWAHLWQWPGHQLCFHRAASSFWSAST